MQYIGNYIKRHTFTDMFSNIVKNNMSTSPDHQNASPSTTVFNNNGRPLRYPVLDDKEHALM